MRKIYALLILTLPLVSWALCSEDAPTPIGGDPSTWTPPEFLDPEQMHPVSE